MRVFYQMKVLSPLVDHFLHHLIEQIDPRLAIIVWPKLLLFLICFCILLLLLFCTILVLLMAMLERTKIGLPFTSLRCLSEFALYRNNFELKSVHVDGFAFNIFV